MKSGANKYVICMLMNILFLAVSCGVPTVTEYSVHPSETPGTTLNAAIATLSATSTPINILTQTPLPTLSSTQVLQIVRELYASNGGCKLPCLLGIIPGQTSIQDVYNQFSQIGYFEDQTRPIDTYQNIAFATAVPPNELVGTLNDNRWGFSMRVINGNVVGLLTGATDIEEFSMPSLSKFLTYFGKPEEIWVMDIESMSGNPDYEMILYYPSKGIFIRWRGEVESVVAQSNNNLTVMVCPQPMPTKADTKIGLFPPHFYLFTPNENMTLDAIIKSHLSEDPGGSYQLMDNTDLEKFYTMYMDSTTQDCFPISYSFSP
jgi:hypothetical protein